MNVRHPMGVLRSFSIKNIAIKWASEFLYFDEAI